MKNSIILFFVLLCFKVYSQEPNINNSHKKNIRVIEYYENGKLKEKGKKKFQSKLSSTPSGRTNGIMTYFKQGKWIEYYSNGNKKRIVVYDKGEVIKELKNWNENGTKK